MFLDKRFNKVKSFLFAFLILLFLILLFNITFVSNTLMDVYLTQSITDSYSYRLFPDPRVNLSEFFTTPYQLVLLYSVVLNSGNKYESTEKCLNLDEHVQLCDSWVKEYHSGLVDVPLAFFENLSSDTKVLLIGGGDGIATNFLRKYNVSVDQVDIDEKFVEYTKSSEFILQYSNNSWEYPLLNLTIEDAFSFLKKSNKKYDLVFLDLPGLKEDKLLPLYSREFFISLNRSLTKEGVIVMWVYSFERHKEYSEILLNTFAVSGFNYFLPYSAYLLPNKENRKMEDFILVSRENLKKINLSKNDYVSNLSDVYSNLDWQKITFSNKVPVNSVFRPSYSMLIKLDS